MTPDSRDREVFFLLAAPVAALAVFVFDVSVELGVAGGVPYIIVIWLACQSRLPWMVWAAAVVCSALTLTGYAVSPGGGEAWKVLANRLIALLAIWGTTAFVARRHLSPATSDQSGGSGIIEILKQRTVTVLILVFTMGFALVIWQHVRLQDKLVRSSARSEAQRYSEALAVFRTLYTRDVVETVMKHNITVTHDFDSDANRGNAIPLPATLSMRIGNELTHSDLGTTRLYSSHPFPYPGRNGLQDAFGEDAWKALTADPEKPFTKFEDVDGKPSLRYAVADRMRQACVDCHNSHPDSPRRDWKEGDVRGVLEVTLPLEAAVAQTRNDLRESLVFFGAMGLAGTLLLGLVIGRIQQAARTQARLAAIVESTDDAVIAKTLDGIVTSWNRGAERLYGYSANEIIGQPITLLLPPDQPDEVPDILDRLSQGESVDRFEAVRVHKDGRRLDVALTISPVQDADGRVTGASTIARDIGERKRLEELQQRVLEQSRAELDFAYTGIAGPVDGDDSKSSIVRETGGELAGIESFDDAMDLWARQARNIIGAHQSAVSFIPGSFGDGKHAVSMSEKYDRYKSYDVLPNGDGVWALVVKEKLSFCMTDAELTSHPGWKNFSDLRDDRGLEHPPMRGWLAVPVLTRDREFIGVLQLTDKYEGDFTQADQQRLTRLAQLMAPAFSLQHANEQMQLRGEELAEKAALLEVQRQTAVVMAEELKQADQAKNDFLANMSHEIRTPMNAVMGLTEIVLKSELDETQRDYLSTVMDSAEAVLVIINEILDFSKIEAGMLQVESVDFDLHDAVGDTLRFQNVRADRKGLELACFIDPTVPQLLLGDPGRLRQVLTNLVGNAIKFTESGEVVVRVGQESHAGDELILSFTVSDTGIGIPQEKRDAIFQPFEQADMSTTREYGGTGLGLAICQKLIALMGGDIDVDSEPGRGSTFRFTARFQVSENTNVESVPTEMKGVRVLVVDDNATNRTILEQILLAKEMAPVTAASASAGFALLQEAVREDRPFRLLISDVQMPEVDGFRLAEMIRADASLSDLDIIQLTSTGSPGDQQRCQDLRIVTQLTKPAKQSELYNVIMRVLGLGEPEENGWVSIHAEPLPGTLPPLRFLLVEDSYANQMVARAVLSGSGHTTVVANNGEEALDILAEQEFDVVLMDVQMPVMDGLQATAAIRASEEGSDQRQPIIAMTAHAMTGDRERCLAAGMDEFVSKPVHQEPLFRAIAIVLGLSPDSVNGSAADAQDSVPSEKLVDWNGPLGQLRGDHAILKEITQSYIDETRENLSRLPEAIATANDRETRRLAHTAKGAMRFFHADAAVQCGLELEDLAANGDLTSAPELCERFKFEVERVLPILQHFVDTGEM